MTKQPNILIIQADQLTALCLATYGKPFAKTPHMDAIAERGTTFFNNYCNNPVCGPSRASMMTGRLPSDVGVYDNAGEFAASEPTYAHYMRHQGCAGPSYGSILHSCLKSALVSLRERNCSYASRLFCFFCTIACSGRSANA